MYGMGDNHSNLAKTTEGTLDSVKVKQDTEKTFRVPIEELAVLGTGVAPLLPALRTVAENMEIPEEGMCRLANAEVEDVFKQAESGNWWKAMKAQAGKSGMVNIQKLEGTAWTGTTASEMNVPMILLAAVLHSVEKEISEIDRIGKGIEAFLTNEKEDEIEKIVEKLLFIIDEFKNNWENEAFLEDSYETVVAVREKAKSKIIGFQRQVVDPLNSNKIITTRAQIEELLNKVVRNFRYYRLDLFIYSMTSYLEILLSGNYDRDYVKSIKVKVEDNAHKFRSILKRCTDELDMHTMKSMRTNTIKEGEHESVLQDGGRHMKSSSYDLEKDALKAFVEISNSGTALFTGKMEDIIQIYNDTKEICFDNENIYLISK